MMSKTLSGFVGFASVRIEIKLSCVLTNMGIILDSASMSTKLSGHHLQARVSNSSFVRLYFNINILKKSVT